MYMPGKYWTVCPSVNWQPLTQGDRSGYLAMSCFEIAVPHMETPRALILLKLTSKTLSVSCKVWNLRQRCQAVVGQSRGQYPGIEIA